jgi:hypothetical protein
MARALLALVVSAALGLLFAALALPVVGGQHGRALRQRREAGMYRQSSLDEERLTRLHEEWLRK